MLLLCRKRNDSKTLKIASATHLSPVCMLLVKLASMDTACFDECFLFYVILEDIISHKDWSLFWEFSNRYVVAFFGDVLECFKRSPYFIRYLHYNSTLLIKNCTINLLYIFLNRKIWFYGKTKLRVPSHELLVTSLKLKSTSRNSKARVQILEFKLTRLEFKSTSYDFKSTSSRII